MLYSCEAHHHIMIAALHAWSFKLGLLFISSAKVLDIWCNTCRILNGILRLITMQKCQKKPTVLCSAFSKDFSFNTSDFVTVYGGYKDLQLSTAISSGTPHLL